MNRMNRRQIATKMYKHYEALLDQLLEAQKVLAASDGVKSYTIGDRQLSRYDLDDIAKQIDYCLEKMDEYDKVLRGKSTRQKGNIIPTDL